MSKIEEFSLQTINKLGYYVYIYSDPDTKIPFYIGKGKGNRCFAHLSLDNDSKKVQKIKEIFARGKKPLVEILVHSIDEETAFKVEAAAIDLIGIENLTNIQKGHHTSTYGRISVDDLNTRYSQKELTGEEIQDNVITIKITKSYHYGISDLELYDVTRGYWKVNIEQAQKAEYAFSICDGIVLEVYRIAHWFPAFTTMNQRTVTSEEKEQYSNRYEFIGTIAEDSIRKKYIGKFVNNLFPKGNQNPIKYFIQ